VGSFDGPRASVKRELTINFMSECEQEQIFLDFLYLYRVGWFPSLGNNFQHYCRKEISSREDLSNERGFKSIGFLLEWFKLQTVIGAATVLRAGDKFSHGKGGFMCWGHGWVSAWKIIYEEEMR
jgi:hypothetical protein